MLNSAVEVYEWIERGNGGASTECGLHEARCTSSRTTRTAGCAACSRAGSACAESADASARSSLHYSSVYAAEEASSLCAQDVGIRNRDVVSGDGEIEVIFERELDCVFQGEIQLPIAHQLVDARRIRQQGFRHRIGRVGLQGIAGLRHLKTELCDRRGLGVRNWRRRRLALRQ